MKAIVSRNELMAALLFASTDESRWTLSGVCIEIKPGEKPCMVATDGRRLVVIKTEAEQADEFDLPHQLLMRADFLRPICALSKALGGKLFPWIQFENRRGSKQVQVSFVGGDCVLDAEKNALIEGAFPEWRQVLPPRGKQHREALTDLGLNAEFVADYAKAAKLMESKSPVIQMSLVGKDKQVEVKLVGLDNFYGLIMQCKTDDSVEYQPEFVGIVKNLPVEPKEDEGEGTVTISTGGVSSGPIPLGKFKDAAEKLRAAASASINRKK